MYYLYLLFLTIPIITSSGIKRESPVTIYPEIFKHLPDLVKSLPPDLIGKHKGDAARICVIGGSVRHSGAPYYAAIAALKAGADLVPVITPNGTSNVVKTYSPDPVVYPYLNTESITKITPILMRSDVIIIGAGIDAEEEAMLLTYDIINTCKTLKKPIIIDSDSLTALSKNPTILKDYPAPVILTPNHVEAESLIKGMALTNDSGENWYNYWGKNVSVLLKGETDQFFSGKVVFNWKSNEGGSWRRCPCQGNILAGVLGTFFHWALKNEAFTSDKADYPYFSQSVAAYAASKITRYSNSRAFEEFGRGLLASNMVDNIHLASKDVFD